MTLPCGHPQGCLDGNDYLASPCRWCQDIERVQQEADSRTAAVARLFADVQHQVPGSSEWALHSYEPGDPRGCPVCEVLDAALVGATGSDDDRERLRRFRADGLLFLVNLAVLHPRGYALAMVVNANGDPEGLSIVGDGSEPWSFGSDGLDETVDGLVAAEQAREEQWSRLLRETFV